MIFRAIAISALLASGFVAPMSSESGNVESATGPSTVEVPIEDSLEVRPAAGWLFSDCGVLLDASDLVTQCGAESFTVTGPAYDAAIEPVRVSVPLHSASSRLMVDYVIRLADPSLPDAPDTSLDMPFAAGAVSLIPLSELALDCGLCSAQVSEIEVRGVEPVEAGAARVTGAHLVFSANPSYQGAVEVSLQVKDDLGHPSKTFIVTLHISHGEQGLFRGLHMLSTADEQTFTIDQLLFTDSDFAGGAVVSSCGLALHGTVSCLPGGRIHYRPPAGAADASRPADQFAVRLVSAQGRQALASVTLLPEETGDAIAVLARAGGAERAKLEVMLPRPLSEEEASGGATSGFSEIMDTVGAR